MAIPGLGLDQSQLADVINQQYKGYSQKQRNQMMQSAATTPDNWSAITQQANQTATQPTEFLGAGRTSDIPTVSQNGQRLTGYNDSNLSSLYSMNSGYKDTPFDYTDSAGKGYFNVDTQNRIESSGPNFVSGAKTGYDLNPTQAGGYYFSDPWGFSHSLDKVGANNYFVSGNTLNQRTRSGTADTFFGLDPTKDLSGLRYGKHNNQEGLFFDPTKTNLSSLLQGGRNNSAFAEKKKSFMAPFNSAAEQIAKYTDPIFYKSMDGGTDHSLWKDLTNEGMYGAVFNKLDPVLDKLDPMHNTGQNLIKDVVGADTQKEAFNTVAPTLVNMFVPYGGGYLLNALNSASQGNYTGAAINLASYNMPSTPTAETAAPVETAVDSAGNAANNIASNASTSTGIYGSGASLGSVAADKAVQNFITSTALNTVQNGGDLGNALRSAAFSSASGALGDTLSTRLSPELGEIGSKALGGAASGGLNSLFTKNSPIEGSLFGAMSGGLHGFLNSTDRSNNTYSKQQDIKNKQTVQSATKLAKLFTRK